MQAFWLLVAAPALWLSAPPTFPVARNIRPVMQSDSVASDVADLKESAPVVVFVWEDSPESEKAIRLLRLAGATPKLVALNPDSEAGAARREELERITGHSAIPSIWIGGEFCGGYDEGPTPTSPGIVDMSFTGTLSEKLQAAVTMVETVAPVAVAAAAPQPAAAAPPGGRVNAMYTEGLEVVQAREERQQELENWSGTGSMPTDLEGVVAPAQQQAVPQPAPAGVFDGTLASAKAAEEYEAAAQAARPASGSEGNSPMQRAWRTGDGQTTSGSQGASAGSGVFANTLATAKAAEVTAAEAQAGTVGGSQPQSDMQQTWRTGRRTASGITEMSGGTIPKMFQPVPVSWPRGGHQGTLPPPSRPTVTRLPQPPPTADPKLGNAAVQGAQQQPAGAFANGFRPASPPTKAPGPSAPDPSSGVFGSTLSVALAAADSAAAAATEEVSGSSPSSDMLRGWRTSEPTRDHLKESDRIHTEKPAGWREKNAPRFQWYP